MTARCAQLISAFRAATPDDSRARAEVLELMAESTECAIAEL